VLKIGERIEVLRDDGLPVRVIFDKVPDNLRARPTLSVTVDSAHRGPRAATLSYLTPGLGWRADYVALFNEADSKIDVQGWVNSRTRAHHLRRCENPARRSSPSLADPTSSWVSRPRRATLAQPGRRVARANAWATTTSTPGRTDNDCQPADQAGEFPGRARRSGNARLRIRQSVAGNRGYSAECQIGVPVLDQCARGPRRSIARGHPAFYLRDKRGEPQFIGESRIDHTPMGSTLSLATGDAFDVKIQSTVVKRSLLAKNDAD